MDAVRASSRGGAESFTAPPATSFRRLVASFPEIASEIAPEVTLALTSIGQAGRVTIEASHSTSETIVSSAAVAS